MYRLTDRELSLASRAQLALAAPSVGSRCSPSPGSLLPCPGSSAGSAGSCPSAAAASYTKPSPGCAQRHALTLLIRSAAPGELEVDVFGKWEGGDGGVI